MKHLILSLFALLSLSGCAGYTVTGSGGFTSSDGTSYTTEWDGAQWRTCMTTKDGQKVCIGVAPTRPAAVAIAQRHEVDKNVVQLEKP